MIYKTATSNMLMSQLLSSGVATRNLHNMDLQQLWEAPHEYSLALLDSNGD